MKASHPKAHDTVRRHTRLRRAVKIAGPWRVGVSLVFGVVATVLVAWWIVVPSTVLPQSPIQRSSTGWDRESRSTVVSQQGTYLWHTRYARLPGYDLAITVTESDAYRKPDSELPPKQEKMPSWVGGHSFALSHTGADRDWHYLVEICSGFPFRCLAMREISSSKVSVVSGGKPNSSTDYLYEVVGAIDIPVSVEKELGLSPPTFLFTCEMVVPSVILPVAFIGNVLCYSASAYLLCSFPYMMIGLHRRLTNRCHPCGYRLKGLTTDTCPECGWAIKWKDDH